MLVSVGDPEGWLPLFGEHGFEGEAGYQFATVLDFVEGWDEGSGRLSHDVVNDEGLEFIRELGWRGEGKIVKDGSGASVGTSGTTRGAATDGRCP